MYERVVIGVDPAASSVGDETGIVVAARTQAGFGVVLDDLSGHWEVSQWVQQVAQAFEQYRADRIVTEVNMGGNMIRAVLSQYAPHLPIQDVRAHASKEARALPVAALYEKKRIFHVRSFPKLETQLCQFIPGQTRHSPDRLDALVWALWALFLQPRHSVRAWNPYA